MNEPIDDPISNQRPEPKMPLGKTVLINFGLMVSFMTASAFINGGGSEAALGSLAMDAAFLVLQVLANLLIGTILLFTVRKEIGRAMLISGLIVGIIGFGACFGKAAIIG